MKRTNNKFRSNNNNNNNNYSNQIYSLNYKFDSCSIAGKCSGTALDLIKKYNELAKEAHSNSDWVSSEIFRQYAEHYRKIVTDINERKNQQAMNMKKDAENNDVGQDNNISNDNITNNEPEISTDNSQKTVVTEVKAAEVVSIPVKKEFTVIEISHDSEDLEVINNSKPEQPKHKRMYTKKVAAV